MRFKNTLCWFLQNPTFFCLLNTLKAFTSLWWDWTTDQSLLSEWDELKEISLCPPLTPQIGILFVLLNNLKIFFSFCVFFTNESLKNCYYKIYVFGAFCGFSVYGVFNVNCMNHYSQKMNYNFCVTLITSSRLKILVLFTWYSQI